MRVLGLDVGDRRIGVAMSDPLGMTAQRLMVLQRDTAAADVEAVRDLVERHGASAVVMGLPMTLRGERGPQAQRVEAFAHALRQRLAVPVHFVDERFTTVQGTRALRETGVPARKQKPLIDQVAAQLILQHFLDAQRSAHQLPDDR